MLQSKQLRSGYLTYPNMSVKNKLSTTVSGLESLLFSQPPLSLVASWSTVGCQCSSHHVFVQDKEEVGKKAGMAMSLPFTR